jgi:mono/diheme cytochrome c family protein
MVVFPGKLPLIRNKTRGRMMKKLLKWTGILIGGLIGLVVLVIGTANVIAMSRLNRQYTVNTPAIVIPTDETAAARGQHLVEVISQCSGCHGPDLGGTDFFDGPAVGYISAPNLTSGDGGIGAYYSDEDWTRALVHGVAPDGRMLLIMPSQFFRHYSDDDLGAVIAYLKSLPPVDRQLPSKKLSLLGNTFFGLNFFGHMPAELIDHTAPRSTAPMPGVSVEYGEYLVNIAVCKDCHGDNLAGGSPGPDSPWADNLTPGGNLAAWSEDDFITAIRTGITPAGRSLIPYMPWQEYSHMTDEELQSIWLYLQSLPALEENKR